MVLDSRTLRSTERAVGARPGTGSSASAALSCRWLRVGCASANVFASEP